MSTDLQGLPIGAEIRCRVVAIRPPIMGELYISPQGAVRTAFYAGAGGILPQRIIEVVGVTRPPPPQSRSSFIAQARWGVVLVAIHDPMLVVEEA